MRIHHAAGFIAMIFGCIFLSLAFRSYWNSPVKGSIVPASAGSRAWVFSKTDTLSAPILQGNFMIEHVKPGNYTLMIEGKPPYRNAVKQGVIVVDGQLTDAGVIQMNQ
ncbi:MAG TPA: hypothetical protein VGM24_10165 [Puia sp.]|jgi:hypothetical protein